MNYRKGFERIGYALSTIFSLACFSVFLYCRCIAINNSKDLVVFLCVSVATFLVSFTFFRRKAPSFREGM